MPKKNTTHAIAKRANRYKGKSHDGRKKPNPNSKEAIQKRAVLTQVEKTTAFKAWEMIVKKGCDYMETANQLGITIKDLEIIMRQNMIDMSPEMEMLQMQWLFLSIQRLQDLYKIGYGEMTGTDKVEKDDDETPAKRSGRKLQWMEMCKSLIETQAKIIEGAQPKGGSNGQTNSLNITIQGRGELYDLGVTDVKREFAQKDIEDGIYREIPEEDPAFAELTLATPEG